VISGKYFFCFPQISQISADFEIKFYSTINYLVMKIKIADYPTFNKEWDREKNRRED